MPANKKNSGLSNSGVFGGIAVFMITVKRIISRPGRRRSQATQEPLSMHMTGAWENQELWRRRLSI